jgi:tetratricopeptide (TPR) repeat protein
MHAEPPLLSSKAVRISLQAKKGIERHDEKAIQAAVEDLQGLLRESSFRRLEPQAQVHILLLLSKGLERLEKYKEQELLLLSCAKREELYRFQVPLKTVLAKSFIQQHRFSEAEHILSKIIKSSCAHLSLEEKGAIANVLVFRDEYVSYLLRQGDKLAEGGKWEEALKLYSTVLSTMHRQQFPYQASSVEKKRIRQKILLRIAEVHFCLGNFEETITSLHDWEEDLFFDPADQPILTRRLFLIALAHQKLQDTEAAHKWLQKYFSSPYLKRPFLDRHAWCSPLHPNDPVQEDLSPALLLWKAQEALHVNSPTMLSQSCTILQKKVKIGDSITHILNGFHASLEQNLPLAVQELTLGLTKPQSPLDASWREASFHLLAECAFERMMLLTCSNQQKNAEESAQRLIPLFSSVTHPNTLLRVGAIRLFLYTTTLDSSHLAALQEILDNVELSQKPYNHSLFTLLHALKKPSSPQEILCDPDSLSVSDRFFATWLALIPVHSHHPGRIKAPGAERSQTGPYSDESGLRSFTPGALTHQVDRNVQELALGVTDLLASGTEQSPDDTYDIVETPFSQYLAALSQYQQAMSDEIPVDQATTSLQICLESVGFDDVRPQLTHCLIDLALHTSQCTKADELVNTLIKRSPNYPCLPQAILSCIFSFEEAKNVANERDALCQHIFGRQRVDIHTLLLMLHLFETRQQLTFEHTNAIQPFGLALIARAEARNLVADAAKAKEPSVIKELVQGAKKAFDICRTHALESVAGIQDPESLCFIWGLLFGIANEQIEVLEHYITTDSAFNELPCLLEDAARTLRQDLSNFKSSVPRNDQYMNPTFLHACLCCSLTADIYAETFRRELEEALAKTKDFSDTWYTSRQAIRSLLYLSKALRESNRVQDAMCLLSCLRETEMRDDFELALEIAMEKSLCLRELHQPNKAMALLAWVINGPYASSLRVKAMILRADMYLSLNRKDLAIRQLESVSAKGGEWGAVADRKLRELYGIDC